MASYYELPYGASDETCHNSFLLHFKQTQQKKYFCMPLYGSLVWPYRLLWVLYYASEQIGACIDP